MADTRDPKVVTAEELARAERRRKLQEEERIRALESRWDSDRERSVLDAIRENRRDSETAGREGREAEESYESGRGTKTFGDLYGDDRKPTVRDKIARGGKSSEEFDAERIMQEKDKYDADMARLRRAADSVPTGGQKVVEKAEKSLEAGKSAEATKKEAIDDITSQLEKPEYMSSAEYKKEVNRITQEMRDRLEGINRKEAILRGIQGLGQLVASLGFGVGKLEMDSPSLEHVRKSEKTIFEKELDMLDSRYKQGQMNVREYHDRRRTGI